MNLLLRRLLRLPVLLLLTGAGRAQLTYSLNPPGANTNGGCLLAADAEDGNAATNRHRIAVSVAGTITRANGTPASVQERYRITLRDAAGTALDLDDGAGGTATFLLAGAQTYTYPPGAPATRAINVSATLTPVLASLPRSASGYTVRVESQIYNSFPGQYVTTATANSAPFSLTTFTNTVSTDVSRNLVVTQGAMSWTRTCRILNVAGKDLYEVQVPLELKRYDAFEAPPGDATVSARFAWNLTIPGGNSIGVGEIPVTFTIPSHGTSNGLPVPSTAMQTATLRFAPGSPLAPGLLDESTLTATLYTEEEPGGGEADQGTRSAPARAGTFSGKIIAGPDTADFTELSFVPASVVQDATGYNAAITIPSGAAQVTGAGGLTFGVAGLTMHYNWNTGDLEVAGTSIPVGGGPFALAGVTGQLAGAGLTSTGFRGQLLVDLPPGSGITNDARRRVLDGQIDFGMVPLQPAGTLAQSSFTHAPGGSLYLVHETLPHRFAVPEIKWDVAAGEFTANGSPDYVRALEQSWLASDAAASPAVVTDADALNKASNDGHWRATDAAPTDITVAASGALSATVTLASTGNAWRTHYPYDLSVSAQGGTLAVENGAFTAASVIQSAGGELTLRRDPSGTPECGVTALGTGTAEFNTAAGTLGVTQDGGLRGAGTLAVPNLSWGGLHNSQPTHAVSGISAATLHISGTVLRGSSATAVTGHQRAAALLYSGIGQPGNAAYAERPGGAAYLDGFADYAGINIRASSSALTGRSHLGGKDTGDYALKSIAKYNLNFCGVTGIHDAVTSPALTNLKLYDYDTQLDGLRLSFLRNDNLESATAGSLTTPFPSSLSIAFSKLLFTGWGGLKSATLPEVPVTQTLAYWSTSFTPLVMTFTEKDPAGCVPGAPERRFLTLGGDVQMPQVSTVPVRGSLAFYPNGNLVPASEGLAGGVDSSLPAPAVIPIKARGALTWPLRPAGRVRFNNYAIADAADRVPGRGFLFVAGALDLPFFEDARVMAHFAPNNISEPIHLTGGWPTDPAQPQRGWTEAGGRDPFNHAQFDSSSRGYPPGVSLATCRAGVDGSHLYRVHARKDWRRIVQFEFPLQWSAQTRSFTGLQKNDQDLIVVKAEAQLKRLDACGAEMAFGAEVFNPAQAVGLPSINTESFSRMLTEGVNSLSGMDRKIADAFSNAVTGQINQLFIRQGREAMDRLLADTTAQFSDAALRAALDEVLDGPMDQLQLAMEQAYAAGGNSLTAIPANVVVQNARNALATAAGQVNTLRAAITDSAQQASSLVNEIARQLEAADKGLAEIEKLCDTAGVPGGAGAAQPALEFIYRISREAIKEIFQQDLVGSNNTALRTALNDLLGDLLEEAGPSLTDAVAAIRRVRAIIGQMRGFAAGAAEASSALVAQVNTVFNDASRLISMMQNAVDSFLREIATSRDAAQQFFNDNSPEKLRERLISHILAAFHASPLGTALKESVARIVDPVRSAYNQALDLVLAEINHMINEATLKVVKEFQTAVTGPIRDAIANAVNTAFGSDKQKQAEGMPNQYGKSNGAPGTDVKVMAMAKLQGYARTKGDTLDFLRVDTEITIKMPDGIEFKGYFQIKNVDSDSPSVSCRGSAGAVQTEISMGATAGVSMQASGGTKSSGNTGKNFKLAFDAKFSLDAAGDVNGFDGFMEITSNAIDIGGFSLQRMTLAVGIGGGEAYMFGGAEGSVWLLVVTADTFMGMTKQVAVLEKALDPQSFRPFIQPARNGGNPCLDQMVVGLSARGTGQGSLNRFFGIPDTCLFSARAGILFGTTFVIFPDGPGGAAPYRIGYGQRQGYKVNCTLLCVIELEGVMSMFYGGSGQLPLELNGGGPLTLDAIAGVMLNPAKAMASIMSTFRGTAHGMMRACAKILFIEKCAEINVIGTVQVNPPDVDYSVDF